MDKFVKSLTLLCFILFLWSSFVYSDTSKEQEIRELKQQLLLIQKRLERLEKEQEKEKKETAEVKKFVGTVYKKTGGIIEKLDKIKLSASVDFYSTYYNVIQDIDKGVTNTEDTFINLMDLKFTARPTDEIQFHTTLRMYKLWGGWNSPYSIGATDYDVTSTPTDTTVRVNNAYVDYRPKFLKNLVNLEFGRIPTSGGYLTKYRYNVPSKSSYPDLAFNGNVDGVALTFYLDKFIPFLNYLTFVYNESKYDKDSAPFISDDVDLSDVKFYTIQLDSKVPFLDNSKFILLWIRTDQLSLPYNSEQRESIKALLNEQIKNNTGGLSELDTISYPEYLGYFDKLVAQFDCERILRTPLDVFASIAYSWTNPNGKAINYTMKGIPGIYSAPAHYIVSSNNQEEKEGRAVYIGVRYNLELAKLNNPKIGFEYNYGSKNWIGINPAAIDPFKKLNIRGDVYEWYIIQPFVENKIQLRIGYQYIDRDYSDSLLGGVYGAPEKVDEIDKLFYMSLDFSL